MKFLPRDFFLNIASLATLYVSVTAFITLLFQYINVLFPDVLEQGYYYGAYDPYSGAMRFAIATLLVSFPLYILFTRMVHQDIRKNPELHEGRLRLWLIYITLFIAGAAVAGDVVVLINTFLSGELTTRFMLKVAVIFLVTGSVFMYYLHELYGTWKRKERESKMIGGVAGVIIIASIVAAFFVIGSPAQQRVLRFDNQRVQDLQMIQSNLLSYWQQKEGLPTSLTELEDPLVGFVVPLDPETKQPYEYRTLGPLSFELCATFAGESKQLGRGQEHSMSMPIRDPYGVDSNWQHQAGRACFTRTIDPERFPPFREMRQ